MGKQRWDKDRHGDRGGWGGGTELLVGQEEKGCEEGEGSRRKTGLVVDTNRVVLWPLVQVKLGKVERGVEVATSRISLVEGVQYTAHYKHVREVRERPSTYATRYQMVRIRTTSR